MLVVGCVLTLGAVVAVVGRTAGLLLAFNRLGEGSPDAELLAHSISVAMYSTVIGACMCLVGVALIIIAGINMSKKAVARREERGTERPTSKQRRGN